MRLIFTIQAGSLLAALYYELEGCAFSLLLSFAQLVLGRRFQNNALLCTLSRSALLHSAVTKLEPFSDVFLFLAVLSLQRWVDLCSRCETLWACTWSVDAEMVQRKVLLIDVNEKFRVFVYFRCVEARRRCFRNSEKQDSPCLLPILPLVLLFWSPLRIFFGRSETLLALVESVSVRNNGQKQPFSLSASCGVSSLRWDLPLIVLTRGMREKRDAAMAFLFCLWCCCVLFRVTGVQ